MVASNYTGANASNGRRVSERANAGVFGLSPVGQLLDRATGLGLRAPELAMVLGERAAALAEAEGSDELWVRAESLVVSARVRLGYRAATVGRAVAALRAAEAAGHSALAATVRTDLAVCARSLGAPLTGLAALRPVLDAAELSAPQRAAALSHLVGCISQFGRKPELDRVLLEADRLCAETDELGGDERLLVRGLLRVAISAHRRRHADLTGAADAARTGIGYLDRLENPEADGGLVRVRLVLQLVCTLLDWGDSELALELAQPVFAAPQRAAVVAPAGWMRFAIATRVHLPAGAGEAAAMLLREAVHAAERHSLHALTARLWLELAHVEERLGRPGEAIQCLHSSRAAEHVHARARRQACSVLAGEFGSGEHAHVDLDDVLARTRQHTVRAARVADPVPSAPTVPSAPEPMIAPVTTLPVPELQLAPAPAAEPAPRVSFTREPERPAARAPEPAVPELVLPASDPVMPQAALPPAPEPAPAHAREPAAQVREPVAPALPKVDWETEWNQREQRYRTESAASVGKTRHDSEHGSVAARSVLDRLGISAGGGGGRRRAADETDRGGSRRAEPEEPRSYTTPEPGSYATSGPSSYTASGLGSYGALEPEPASAAEPERLGPPAAQEPPAAAEAADGGQGVSMTNEWLPRLRLPPSLAPIDDLGISSSPASETSWEPSSPREETGFGEPFGADYSKAIMDDEPPADAGLAELLARALAEHRAGTSSAAALVKKLGTQHGGSGEPRPVNGHRPTGDDRGRHRNRD
ncbi:hypothetical protein [Amycolatopsis anabasis]|uniref:hypothetical protein n=1 Tax=Amycolatopsis anabasis TaxID=1840409 RepID=UPI001FE8A8D8|nr:hypothetical protein [Amycolatopsis anabasis]